MASPVLHIKDSYYFEVPKGLWTVHLNGKQQFTGAYETWLRLDDQFQQWEAHHFYPEYAKLCAAPKPEQELVSNYLTWKGSHQHAGKPFWRFIQEEGDRDWYQQRAESASFKDQWRSAIENSSDHEALNAFRHDASIQWSGEKLAAYNHHLSGKILIPQPFARLRNLYEKEWGIGISRFLMIEVAVGLLLWILFAWLARRVTTEIRPRGGMWNLLEVFVVFVRDEIARPMIGHEPAKAHAAISPGHEHAPGVEEQVASGGHGVAKGHQAAKHTTPDAVHGSGAVHEPAGEHVAAEPHQAVGSGHGSAHHHDPQFDADRFVPLLLTIFFFVLGCNLAGMLPWVGAPTGEFGTTSAVAIVTFATGIVFGIRRFGVVGYFLNQIPPIDLPWFMAIPLKVLIFLLEMFGLCIKHAILAVRLLANMVAGHIVLLSILALAFSLEGARGDWWSLTFLISVVGSVLISCLELFVAFLQAYVFTFLSAMFIGAAIHSH